MVGVGLVAAQAQMTSALVLFSGGQDSATCLAWALDRFSPVETVAFDYGQRHRIELEYAHRFRSLMGKVGEHHELQLPVLGQISDTALTRESEIHLREDGLPSTFVPGRNILFLTLAAALAYRRGIADIVGGMCETDYSGYPDCREETIDTLADAIVLGMQRAFRFYMPLMRKTKAQTWAMAAELGVLEHVRLATMSCYLGNETEQEWGRGCGSCPACLLRGNGWREYNARVLSRSSPAIRRKAHSVSVHQRASAAGTQIPDGCATLDHG